MTRITMAVILCTTMGVGGVLDLSLSLRKDTFQPYEPIYARLDVSNGSATAVELPQVNNFSVGYVFDFSVIAPTGETLRLGRRLASPRWYTETLPPTAMVHAVTDLAGYASRLDPESRGVYCVRPGLYAASARRGDAVSNSVTFTVREPTADEQGALGLYRDLVYYRNVAYWNQPGGPKLNSPVERARDQLRRTEELARRIVKRCPRTLYAFLAERELAWNYHSRVSGSAAHLLRSSPQAGAWRDSTRVIYSRVLNAHPDEPVAEHMLSCDRLPEVFDDSAYTRALLQDLSAAHPGTLVGCEAARQLELLVKRTTEQK